MDADEKRSLVERYLAAYNAFDIGGMMELIHPNIEFKNVSGGEVNANASDAVEYRQLAKKSKELFRSRKQTILKFQSNADEASIEVAYEGVLASDLPNGMEAGETLHLNGQSVFTFRDGMNYRIKDVS